MNTERWEGGDSRNSFCNISYIKNIWCCDLDVTFTVLSRHEPKPQGRSSSGPWNIPYWPAPLSGTFRLFVSRITNVKKHYLWLSACISATTLLWDIAALTRVYSDFLLACLITHTSRLISQGQKLNLIYPCVTEAQLHAVCLLWEGIACPPQEENKDEKASDKFYSHPTQLLCEN